MWAYGVAIIEDLEKTTLPAPGRDIEAFRRIRSAPESWSTVKKECTPAEFEYLTLLWEIYEARQEMEDGKDDAVKTIAETLAKQIPFAGIEQTGVSWELVHASQLMLRVLCTCRNF